MIKDEFNCTFCEAEFYIETDADVVFCPSCGTKIEIFDEPLYDDDELEIDE